MKCSAPKPMPGLSLQSPQPGLTAVISLRDDMQWTLLKMCASHTRAHTHVPADTHAHTHTHTHTHTAQTNSKQSPLPQPVPVSLYGFLISQPHLPLQTSDVFC